MKKGILFLCMCMTLSFAYSQDTKHGIEYPINVKKYINEDKAVWYGWDFSHLKITDHNTYGYMVKNYIPIWLGKLNKYFPEKEIRNKLEKNTFSVDLNSVQNLYKKMDEKSIESVTLFELPIDSIKKIVKQYSLAQLVEQLIRN